MPEAEANGSSRQSSVNNCGAQGDPKNRACESVPVEISSVFTARGVKRSFRLRTQLLYPLSIIETGRLPAA
ncbi:hypothetical protein TgHK011_008169 [Trichoderma gracile]|nr:hypothetical protein TgHK011_008169 [Trichoderma gracile]